MQTWVEKGFLEVSKSRKYKGKLVNSDLMKIKNFFFEMTLKRMKRQTAVWEKIFAIPISDKGFTSRLYKELSNSVKLNSKQLVKVWTDTSEEFKWSVSACKGINIINYHKRKLKS